MKKKLIFTLILIGPTIGYVTMKGRSLGRRSNDVLRDGLNQEESTQKLMIGGTNWFGDEHPQVLITCPD